jgi:uncharacterized repeat protein (TIGR01451 family)
MKHNKGISLLLIFIFLIQLISPYFTPTIVGEEVKDAGGLSVSQEIVEFSGNTVKPNEIVTVRLRYSVSSATENYHNVVIKYTLPYGAVYKGTSETGHILNTAEDDDDKDGDNIYNSKTRTLMYKIGNNDGSNPLICSGGISGYLDIKFNFSNPSLYSNGETVKINKAEFSGNINSDSGELKVAYSEALSLIYDLEDSWIIDKEGPTTAKISKDPLQTELLLDYTIKLKDGNIDLKDVEIIDTIPEHATFVSASLSPTKQKGKKIIWKLKDVKASKTTSIDVKLKFPIIRDIGDVGVTGGDTQKNSVTVSGYPIKLDDKGEIIKSNDKINFKKSSDSIITEFVESNAKWGVETNEDFKVILTKNPTVKKVEATYYIKFNEGDMSLKNVDLNYEIPDDAILKSSSIPTTSVNNNILTWHFDDVTVGSSPEINIVLEYPIDRTTDHTGGGVYDNQKRINTVTATGYPIKIVDGNPIADSIPVTFNPSEDKVTTTFNEPSGGGSSSGGSGEEGYDDVVWKIEKTGPKNDIKILNDDSTEIDVSYSITLKSTGIEEYNIPLKEAILVDTLPSYATIKSSNKEYSTEDENKVVWKLADINPKSPPTINYTVTYIIDRDDSDGITGVTPNYKAMNTILVREAYPIDKNGDKSKNKLNFTDGNDTDKVYTNFVSDDAQQVGFSKYIHPYYKKKKMDCNYGIGNEIRYVLKFYNNSNYQGLHNGVLTDEDLSNYIDYTEISLGESNLPVNYIFKYKTNNYDWKIYGTNYNTQTKNIINIKNDLKLEENDYLTGIKIEFEDIPKGFKYKDDYLDKINIVGNVNSKVVNKEIISNSAKFDYKHKNFSGDLINKTLSDSVQFTALNDTPWISEFSKKLLTSGQAFPTLKTLSFELMISNDDKLGTGALKNPVIIDVVPDGFLYITNSSGEDVWESTWDTLNPGVQKPKLDIWENSPSIGQTTLKWYWDSSYNLPEGKSIKIKYDLKIKSYADIGEHFNNCYMFSEERYEANGDIVNDEDTSNLDKNDNTTHYLNCKSKIVVLETPAINSYKWVKGELDDYNDSDGNKENNYNRFPNMASTTPGGAADYKLDVFNAGNVYIKQIELIDILPYIGDTEVLNPNRNRNSKWRPYLVQSLESLEKDDINVITDIYGNKSKANVKVYYSTANDPKRKRHSGEIGTQDPNWLEEPPKDISNVKSLKFVISNFQDGKSEGLNPGAKATIHWKMRSPVGSPTNGDVAWNSISMSGIALHKNKKGKIVEIDIPPNEPNMVGIKVETNPLGEIGDFVWFDKNSDSIQNDGYDDENAGVNGIAVNLYKKDTGSGKFILKDTTITGDNMEGNPGYYLFSTLETGEYYVTYNIPSYYNITDNKNDSKGYIDKGVIRTPVIFINTDDNTKRIIHNIDLGLKQSLSASDPKILLDKKAVGYKKKDGTLTFFKGTEILFDESNNCVKEPVNKEETIIYKIGIKNNGSVPLHNIKLQDVMKNSGFKFTKVKYNNGKLGDIASNADINNINKNTLTVKKLEVNDIYEFEAEYLVQESDISNEPIKNILKLWANELKDQSSIENPYIIVNEQVDIANLRIEKTVSQIKKTGTDKFMDVAVNNIGVEAGDTIKYKIIVYNNGSIDLNNVAVNDKMLGISNYNIPVINKGNNVVIEDKETEYVVVGNESDPFTNIVTTTQKDIRYEVEDEVDVNFKGFSITKTVTKINNEVPTTDNGKLKDGKFIVNIGDEIEYSVTVTNTDNTMLKNITLTKDTITNSNGSKDMLANIIDNNPSIKDLVRNGDFKTYTVKYTVSEDNIRESNTELIINEVWGKSEFTNNKSAKCNVSIANLDIKKTADKTDYYVDDVVQYTIIVTNNGTVELNNVTVKDPMLSELKNQTISKLSVNESKSIIGTYVVTEDDLKNGKIVNTVVGDSNETKEVSDICTVNVIKKSTSEGGGEDLAPPKEPEENNTPNNPKPPKKHNNAEKPEKPKNPEVLEQPEEPKNPEVLEQPKEPKNPEIPEQPKEPKKETKKIVRKKDEIPKYVTPKDKKVIDIVEKPKHGTVVIDQDGNIEYIPEHNYKGSDTFKIKVKDANGEDMILEIIVPEEEIPEGTINILPQKLPQTSEDNQFYYILGFILMFVGVLIGIKNIKLNKIFK